MAIYNESMAGGLNVKDCTADASKILEGYTAGVGKEIVTGEMADNGGVDTAIVDGVLKEGYTSGGEITDMFKPSGVERNFVVSSYGGDIKKGDFVGFEDAGGTWTSRLNVSTTQYSGRYCCGTEIRDGVVLTIFYNSSNVLYSTLLSVSGTTVTKIAEQQLVTGCNSSPTYNITRLSDNKACVVYETSSSINLMVVEVGEDNSINICSNTTVVSSVTREYSKIGLTNLSDNKVFIGYYMSSNVYGVVCNILDDNTVQVGSPTGISATYKYPPSVSRISENAVVMSSGANAGSCSYIVTVDGTTIQKVNEYTSYDTSSAGYPTSCVGVGGYMYYRYYWSGSSSSNCYVIIHSVNNNTISNFESVRFDDYSNSTTGHSRGLIAIGTKSFAGFFRKGNYYYLYDHSTQAYTSLSSCNGSGMSFVQLGNMSVLGLYPHSTNNTLNVMVRNAAKVCKCDSSNCTLNGVYGIAMEDGSAGDTIKVLVADQVSWL